MASSVTKVFVGHYNEISESSRTKRKLTEAGIVCYLVHNHDEYTLLVYTSLNKDKAEGIKKALLKEGYDAYTEETSRLPI